MERFIKAELYKLDRNKLSMIIPLILGMIILGIAYVLRDVLNIEFIYNNLDFVMMGALALVILVLSVLSEEISIGTLKNLLVLNYRIDRVLQWKVVVQMINAIVLFAYFLLVFIEASIIMQHGMDNNMEHLKYAVIKIIISIPLYIIAVLIIDMIFLKVKSTIVTVLIYYYVFMQFVFFLLIAGHGIENKLVRIIFMPIQLGHMYGQDLTVNSIFYTLLSEFIYLVVCWKIYVSVAKKYSQRLVSDN